MTCGLESSDKHGKGGVFCIKQGLLNKMFNLRVGNERVSMKVRIWFMKRYLIWPNPSSAKLCTLPLHGWEFNIFKKKKTEIKNPGCTCTLGVYIPHAND